MIVDGFELFSGRYRWLIPAALFWLTIDRSGHDHGDEDHS